MRITIDWTGDPDDLEAAMVMARNGLDLVREAYDNMAVDLEIGEDDVLADCAFADAILSAMAFADDVPSIDGLTVKIEER